MAIFGVKIENSPEVKQFFSDTNDRLQGENLVKNPFNGGIRYRAGVYIVKICPIYANFTPVFPLLGFGLTTIFGFRWWHLIFYSVGLLGWFWSNNFFKFVMKKGLRKAGYTGKLQFIKESDIIEKVVFEWVKPKS